MSNIIGGIAFIGMAFGAVYYAIPHNDYSISMVTRASISNAIKENKTLNDIFDIMKRQSIDYDLFDDMLSAAGERDMPEAPSGWKYKDTKEGISLSNVSGPKYNWQIGLNDGTTVERQDCTMDKKTILCGAEKFIDYSFFSQQEIE